MRDAWRLAAGTFLAVPVRPPRRVDSTVAARAMVLAPITALPAAFAWLLLAAATERGWLAPLVASVLALTVTALVSRAMHLDGLADTADGLTSGYDRDRALEVMRRSDTGPAGTAALVLVLLIQVAALSSMIVGLGPAVLAAVALVSSRLAPAVVCRRGVMPARPGGLGQSVAGTVGPWAATGAAAAVALLGTLALAPTSTPPYAAGLVTLAAVLSAWLVTRHAQRRIGGVTGDVIGAAIEISLAAALVTASSSTGLL